MLRCFAGCARSLCLSVGIFLTMQKSVPQSSVWVRQLSLAVPGLSSQLPSGTHSYPVPTAQKVHRDSRCLPTSIARALAAVTAKAVWLHPAPGHQQHGHKRASVNLWCQPKCGACARLRSWLCRSLSAPFFRCLDALAVQDNRAGLRHTPCFEAHFLTQGIVQSLQRTVTPPAPVAGMNRAPMRELTGQSCPEGTRPLTACAQNIKNRVDNTAPVNLRWATETLFDKRANTLPLRIAQIR